MMQIIERIKKNWLVDTGQKIKIEKIDKKEGSEIRVSHETIRRTLQQGAQYLQALPTAS